MILRIIFNYSFNKKKFKKIGKYQVGSSAVMIGSYDKEKDFLSVWFMFGISNK